MIFCSPDCDFFAEKTVQDRFWDQSLVGLTYGVAPVDLNATATGGPVTYTSSAPDVMEINGTAVSSPRAGEAAIEIVTGDLQPPRAPARRLS